MTSTRSTCVPVIYEVPINGAEGTLPEQFYRIQAAHGHGAEAQGLASDVSYTVRVDSQNSPTLFVHLIGQAIDHDWAGGWIGDFDVSFQIKFSKQFNVAENRLELVPAMSEFKAIPRDPDSFVDQVVSQAMTFAGFLFSKTVALNTLGFDKPLY